MSSSIAEKRRWAIAALAVLAVTVVAAGCGGGEDSGTASETPSAGGGGEGVAKAERFVQEHSEPPAQIFVKTPMQKKPEAGKHVIYMDCGLPVCGLLGEGMKEGAAALGWDLEVINTGTEPEQIQSAWSQAVQAQPEAIAMNGTPPETFEKQLGELTSKGVPYVTEALFAEVEPPIDAIIATKQDFVERGKWLANWVVADSGGDAHAAIFTINNYPILEVEIEAFEKEYEAFCPDCSVEVVGVPAEGIGKDVPNRIVSYVQQKPDTNYIVPSFGDIALGVPQALQAASIPDMKIISQAGGLANYQYIGEGLQTAEVPEPTRMIGWLMVDALARKLNGETLPQDEYEVLPRNYVTEDNLDQISQPKLGYDGPPDFESQFEELWQVK